MNKIDAKILILVEGAKTDVKLMKHLLDIYGISRNHEVVSYNTNIYTLYKEMFADNDPRSIDLLQLLKSKENNVQKKKIFDENYSDILLIFDLDPQDNEFSASKILEMQSYFTESSDMGKLYINYPMVEAFYHLKSIPDNEYNERVVDMHELLNHSYKTRVNHENRNHDYTKFAINRKECNIIIKQNLSKGTIVSKNKTDDSVANMLCILNVQLQELVERKRLYVLCTCVYYIADYNSKLIDVE